MPFGSVTTKHDTDPMSARNLESICEHGLDPSDKSMDVYQFKIAYSEMPKVWQNALKLVHCFQVWQQL